MENGPLIYKFSTDAKKYVYDAATDHILCVDDITYEIIDDFGRLSRDEIIAKYSSKYHREQIAVLINDLELVAREKGCFPLSRPEIGLPLKRVDYEHQLNNLCHTVTIEVTDRCNLRCKYCVFSGDYPNRRTHGTSDMNWEAAKETIDYMFARCSEVDEEILNIGFYGGELLLNFQLIKQCIEYAKANVPENKQLMYSITSNLTLMTPEIAEYFVENNVSLLVSLDGPKYVHDRCRIYPNSKGSYDKVMSGLEMIRKCSEKYYEELSYNATLSFPIDMLEVDKFFLENFPRESHLSISSISEGNEKYFSEFSEDELKAKGEGELFKLFYDAAINGELFEGGNGPFLGKKSKVAFQIHAAPMLRLHKRIIYHGWPQHPMAHAGPCIVGLRKMFVSTDGSIYPCDRSPQNKLYCVGNINNGGFDVNKAYELMTQYYALSSSECSNCWAVRLCQQCFIQICENNSLSRDKKLAICNSVKRQVSHKLKLYCSILEKCGDAFEDGGTVIFS